MPSRQPALLVAMLLPFLPGLFLPTAAGDEPAGGDEGEFGRIGLVIDAGGDGHPERSDAEDLVDQFVARAVIGPEKRTRNRDLDVFLDFEGLIDGGLNHVLGDAVGPGDADDVEVIEVAEAEVDGEIADGLLLVVSTSGDLDRRPVRSPAAFLADGRDADPVALVGGVVAEHDRSAAGGSR